MKEDKEITTHVPEGWPEMTPARRTQLAKRAAEGPAPDVGGARNLMIALGIVAFVVGILAVVFSEVEGGGMLLVFFTSAISVVILFIPAFIAHVQGHPRASAITLLNVLAGWTIIGWIAALIWALSKPK